MNLAISLLAESKWSKGSNRFIAAVHLNLSTSAVILSECLASRGWLVNFLNSFMVIVEALGEILCDHPTQSHKLSGEALSRSPGEV